MTNVTELPSWQALINHHQSIHLKHMRDWFAEDPERFARFTLNQGEILLDYSRNRITEETLKLLCNLAHECQLAEKIKALVSGQNINTTERRPALHTALRDITHQPILVNGENIANAIAETQAAMRDMVQRIHTEAWRGVSGKPIRYIVNIGIGGSYWGPKMTTSALKEFAISDLAFHFISTVDMPLLEETLEQIDPEQTLFIISSKSFTTLETMTNASTLTAWMLAKYGKAAIKHHFVAITAAPEKARDFGIPEENILRLWHWVGGRYSIWSAIGLPLMLMIGSDQFQNFLAGAHAMDKHFQEADFAHNMPVILALLSIWYTNFFGASTHAIIPYAHRLRDLIPYLQQADMESNGKSINLHGQGITYATGPVLFGLEGCDGQHAYHQLLHQGQHLVPADFLLIGKPASSLSLSAEAEHHAILFASGLSQAQALMRGKTFQEAYDALIAQQYTKDQAQQLAGHQMIPGNKPSNILCLERLTPRLLGALIALYEHKIFAQGVIWQINSFDQWGVELGKQLLPSILQSIQQASAETNNANLATDSATLGLINHFKKMMAG